MRVPEIFLIHFLAQKTRISMPTSDTVPSIKSHNVSKALMQYQHTK